MSKFDTLKAVFVHRLPELTWMAKAAFRHLDPEARAEAVQNTLALTWQGYRSLIPQGRGEEPSLLLSVLCFSIKRTKCGRMVQGKVRARDITERRRIGKVCFHAVDLDGFVGKWTPVPDQVAFRLDTPKFLSTLPERQRRLAEDLSSGMTTAEAAQRYGVTAGAISHFRVRFRELFDQFMSR
jgi:hypothetical protein